MTLETMDQSQKNDYLRRLELKDNKIDSRYVSVEAKKILNEKAAEVALALKNKDMDKLAAFIHPEYGVRLSMDGMVDENDQVFSAREVSQFLSLNGQYVFGHSSDTSDVIEMTPEEYFYQYLWHDPTEAIDIKFNEAGASNYFSNQFHVYEDAIVAEYFYKTSDSIRWLTHRMVFQQYQEQWYVVGFISRNYLMNDEAVKDIKAHKLPGMPDEEKDRVIEVVYDHQYSSEADIPPNEAKALIEARAKAALEALSQKDAAAFAQYVHPQKGMRFSPYHFVSCSDNVFMRQEIADMNKSTEMIQWDTDGAGDIQAYTLSDYFHDNIFMDYGECDQIGYNQVIFPYIEMENQFLFYKDAIIVECYFEPSEAELDWEDKRFVFQPADDGQWYMTGFINMFWTP